MKGKVKRVNQKDLKFKKIKLLTKCILNPNINSTILEEDKSEFNSNLKYRMFNHILYVPSIIVYVNNYLNNLFMFNKYSPKHWIKTFALILRSSNINKSTQLYYPKFKVSQRDNFFKIIREYFNVYSNERKLNLEELNCIYELYNNKVISSMQFEQFKKLGTSKEKITGKSTQLIFSEPVEEETPKEKVVDFINETKKYISIRNPCRNYCKSFGRQNLIIKTNVEKADEEVDLTIISLCPNEEEIKSNQVFGHKLGKSLDQIIQTQFSDIPNFKYLYTHLILCENDPSLTVAKLKTSRKPCKEITDMISSRFPSKYKIIIGAKAKSVYGITNPMTSVHKKTFDDNIFVMSSPEEISKSKNKMVDFTATIEHVHGLIKEAKTKDIVNNVEIPEGQQMGRIEKGWILWDTQVINNEFILYTFTNHETMEKRYDKRDIEFPVYIKHGNFNDCDYITSDVDDVIYVNATEKAELSKQLGWNVRSILKNV
jgi:hypothetical protein